MIKLGVVMDPIEGIHPDKDTSLALMLEAQKRKWDIYYMVPSSLFVRDGEPFANAKKIRVFDDAHRWFEFKGEKKIALKDFDVILMRKDPPFDAEYVYLTYILELAEKEGVLVVNRPQALRDANEKFFTTHFPDLCPPTFISSDMEELSGFIRSVKDSVVKPLDGMGGRSVFRVKHGDLNTNVILETLTDSGKKFAMAQKYLPQIKKGDMRIFIVDGMPVSHAIVRVPRKGDLRGNISRGAVAKGKKLGTQELRLAERLGPVLREMGLLFVGVDVIGGKVTEINVTSPTLTRQLYKIFRVNVSALVLDAVQRKLERLSSRRPISP